MKMNDELLEQLLPRQEVILRYCVDYEPPEPRTGLVQRSTLEEVIASHGDAWVLESDLEHEVRSHRFDQWLQDVAEEEKEVGVAEYVSTDEEDDIYVVEEEEQDYVFVPSNVSVNLVSQNELGPDVLGRTWPGTGTIEVASWLYGAQFREVLQHELNHVLYPHLNEREIREKTRQQVSNPRFH